MLATIMRKLGWVSVHRLRNAEVMHEDHLAERDRQIAMLQRVHTREYLELAKRLVEAREELWQRRLPHSLLKLEREYEKKIEQLRREANIPVNERITPEGEVDADDL